LLEKNLRQRENDLYVSRWRVSPEAPDAADDRDPLAPDWWVDDSEASDTAISALGIDLAALDRELLRQAREAEN
jgi:hypothetical protein